MLSRRESLKMVCAGVVGAALAPMAKLTPGVPAQPKKVAWAVGTPGEFNWQSIFAPDEETAKRWWVLDQHGECGCVEGRDENFDPDFVCDACSADVAVDRVKAWDGKKDISPGDWMRAGIGHVCSRCGYETDRHEGGRGVGSEAVCADCITFADWDAIDPERAAELREQAAVI